MSKIHLLSRFFITFFMIAFVSSCEKNEISFDLEDSAKPDKETSEVESIQYNSNVLILNDLPIDSVRIIDDYNLHIYTKNEIEDKLIDGEIIVYQDSLSSSKYFVGKIVTYNKCDYYFEVKTDIPSFQEVFQELSISAEINQNNTQVQYSPDESDIVNYIGIVENSIWNDIETVYQSQNNIDTRTLSKSTSLPIDITLAFEAKPNKNFVGNIYLRLTGCIYIKGDGSYELSVKKIIGLKGTFDIASVATQRTYIPLLYLKNGLTLYSNKIVSLRLKPSFNFYYSGKIKLEAGFNYEIVNADIYTSYNNGEFYNKSYDNKRDAYFRVKSLHTEAEFGFSLNSDLYAFIFSDNFFAGGINTVAGIGVGGEKNVGIQFPDLVNFDCSVYFTPFLEIKPFVSIRMPDLKRFEGPTFKAKTEKFSVNLLPNIHDMNYKRGSKKLQVSAEVETGTMSFIDTEEDGIALFEKDSTKPIAYNKINAVNTRASFNNINFDINPATIYEIAQYSKTRSDGELYGDRILIEVNPWIIFYESTNGDSWYNNSNWCSNKDVNQWYGISIDDYGHNLNLANNNLDGDAYIYDMYLNNVDIIQGNKISSLKIEDGGIRNLVVDGAQLNYLTIKNGSIGIKQSKSLIIDNVYIENGSAQIECYNGELGNVTITNCGGHINFNCSGNILKIHNQDGGADIHGNWNYVEIIGGGGGIEVYGSIGRFYCPYRGGGVCLNGVWNDWEHWK